MGFCPSFSNHLCKLFFAPMPTDKTICANSRYHLCKLLRALVAWKDGDAAVRILL